LWPERLEAEVVEFEAEVIQGEHRFGRQQPELVAAA